MSNWIAACAAFVSLVALYFSYAQFMLNRRIQREASQPYVVPDIQPRAGGSGILVFTLENVGPTVARNVKIEVDPPLQGGQGNDWDEKLRVALGRELSHLPPGRRLEWYFTFGPRFYQLSGDLPRQYTVKVRATGPSGPVEEMPYLIDLDLMQETALERETVVAKLGEIAKQISKRR
ncbi:hypothetical protein ACIQH7_30310 [Streptomyces anulatus]